jgi:hypothetical protein
VHWDGRNHRVHRLVYRLLVGDIVEETLDHLCRNRRCVNPAHLEQTSNKINTLRGEGPTAVNARKATCRNGHSLSGENLVVSRDGKRGCRICKTAWKQRWYEEHREQQKEYSRDRRREMARG